MKTVLLHLLNAVLGTAFRALAQGKGLIVVGFALVSMTSCMIYPVGSPFPPQGGGQGAPQVYDLNNGHVCSRDQNGKCTFQITLSWGGLERYGQTIMFTSNGYRCFADGITDNDWYNLSNGYSIRVWAYHHNAQF